MDIRKLQRAIVDGLEDVKAQNILVFNTEHLTPLFERVIIASGTSNRQTKALASAVRVTVKERGMDVLRCEGEENGEWIIVDCGAAVVHVMQPAIRDYYHLEELWGGKPVKMALGDGKTKLVKASEEDDEGEEEAAPKKAAKKTAAKKTVAASLPGKPGVGKKVAAKAAAEKPAVKKPAAKKPVDRSSTSSREVDHKTPATSTLKVGAAKPAVKKAAAKKSAVTKTVGVKRAAAKPAVKAAVKKAASKKSSDA
ncbi:ribosome silencing factor [Roseateles oligotrophus]|uniref:Ribosomal silencing factor RsfS n=1 Tax=Roseateles oligotrophus TaxID=1769250 RepID=A0ABT2YAK6_9BURK|nr:ribosome silencing factor [Roseateles oligotrophus]MCV2367333.1 ribosome silencing factor [Roseateles oligotrophus]